MAFLYPPPIFNENSAQKTYWGSLYGSANALALVEYIQNQAQVVLLIADNIAHLDALYQSLNFYNDDLTILKFDNWEVLPFDKFSPHPDITSNRLTTLSKLKNLKSGLVITTLETLFFNLCPLEFSEKYSFNIRLGDNIEPNLFAEKLLKIGYHRTTTVMEHGEFNIRGSLIDLYPMGANSPYRLDLFDREVESIRTFDSATQRSESTVDNIALLPAREFSSSQTSIDLFKKNYDKAFAKQGFIYTEVSEGRLPSGIEFYLPLFFASTNTLFDYLPDNTVVATSNGFSDLVDKTYAEIEARYANAKLDLERPPLDIQQVFLNKSQLFSALKQRQNLVIGTSKLPDKSGHLNFSSTLLPPLRIDPQAQNPLKKLSNFVSRFKQKILIVCESQGRQSVLEELLNKHNLEPNLVDDWRGFLRSSKLLNITHQTLAQGLLSKKIAIITEDNLFGQELVAQQRRRRAKHKDFDEAIKSLVEIKKATRLSTKITAWGDIWG
jgi:transcription-repair coupling factor (superfamily II helicase)